MKKIIAITTGEYPTQGVFTLIKYMALSLNSNVKFKKKYELKIFVFHESLFLKTKKSIYNFYLILKNTFLSQENRIHKFGYSSNDFIKECKILKNQILPFSNSKIYNKKKLSLIFPLLKPFEQRNCKSIGYIYDLQHKDIPKLFDKKDIQRRNLEFSNIIKYNDKVFVNSNFVRKGILKSFNISNKKIFRIPFLPYLTDEISNISNNLKKKYGIDSNYFIICNRFWKHKNHELVFKAFSKFVKLNKEYQLICTGDTTDTRDPNYFSILQKKYQKLIFENKIKILGLIPRKDQLNLLKNSKAVIQPTLYEGGPGGFSSYEAIAFQKPLFLSDISINKEIKYKKTIFFSAKSSNNLLTKLIKFSYKKNQNYSIKMIKKKSNANKRKLGKSLLRLINLTINDN